jgi:hypothetical protein
MVQQCVKLKLMSRVSRLHLHEVPLYHLLLNKVNNNSNNNCLMLTSNNNTNVSNSVQRFNASNDVNKHKAVRSLQPADMENIRSIQRLRADATRRPMVDEPLPAATRGTLALLCATPPAAYNFYSLPPMTSRSKLCGDLAGRLTHSDPVTTADDSGGRLGLFLRTSTEKFLTMGGGGCAESDEEVLSRLEDRLLAWHVSISREIMKGPSTQPAFTSTSRAGPASNLLSPRVPPVVPKLKRISRHGREPFQGSKVIIRRKLLDMETEAL